MKIVYSLLVATALCTTTPAMANPPDRHDPQQRVERMSEHLNLSGDQETAVLALMAKSHEEHGQDRDAARASFEAGLKDILTAEQYQQFADRPQRPRGKRPGRSGADSSDPA